MATIGSMTVMLKAQTKDFTDKMKASASTVTKMGERIAWLNDKMSGFYSGFSAGVKDVAKWGSIISGSMAAAFGFVAKGVMQGTDEMVKFADSIGMSAEAFQNLQMVASMAGVNNEKFRTGLEKMMDLVSKGAEGDKGAVATFDKLGLSAQALSRLNPEDMLYAVADAMKSIGSQSDKVAIMKDVFGKSGVGFLNVIRDGSAGLKTAADDAARLGLTLSRMEIAKIERANDAVERMSTSFRNMVAILSSELAPYIAAVADKITAWFARLDMRTMVKEWVPVLLNLFAEIYIGFRNLVKMILDAVADITNALDYIVPGHSLTALSERLRRFRAEMQSEESLAAMNAGTYTGTNTTQEAYAAMWAKRIASISDAANEMAGKVAQDMNSAIAGSVADPFAFAKKGPDFLAAIRDAIPASIQMLDQGIQAGGKKLASSLTSAFVDIRSGWAAMIDQMRQDMERVFNAKEAVRSGLMSEEQRKFAELDKRIAEFEANLGNARQWKLGDPAQMAEFDRIVGQFAQGAMKDIFGETAIGNFRQVNLGAIDPAALARANEKIPNKQLKTLEEILKAIRESMNKPNVAVVGP